MAKIIDELANAAWNAVASDRFKPAPWKELARGALATLPSNDPLELELRDLMQRALDDPQGTDTCEWDEAAERAVAEADGFLAAR